jgi:hypothetical protein
MRAGWTVSGAAASACVAKSVWSFAVALATAVLLGGLTAGRVAAETYGVERIEISGLRRTREATILSLLPRALPSVYGDAELREIERRLANLEIFDETRVSVAGSTMTVHVREKWTLIPEFDLATGSSARDTFVLVGLTEYNFLGTGGALGLSVYHEQRGFGFHAMFEEHVYRRARWSFAGETGYEGKAFRFRDGSAWLLREAMGYLWSTSQSLLSDHTRVELGIVYKRQMLSEVEGPLVSPGGHLLGTSAMITWDDYVWNDLSPSGFIVNVSGTPALFARASGAGQLRYLVDAESRASARLSRTTALMARVVAGLTSRGNANHALLLGTVSGVRGLRDTWYFNWAQVYANLELRQAIPLAARWALQLVLFSDAARYARLGARGEVDGAGTALSAGGGVRLVPTWLSNIVPRFDVARLLLPERDLLFQFALSQYF